MSNKYFFLIIRYLSRFVSHSLVITLKVIIHFLRLKISEHSGMFIPLALEGLCSTRKTK